MNKLKIDYLCDLKLWLLYFLPLSFHLCNTLFAIFCHFKLVYIVFSLLLVPRGAAKGVGNMLCTQIVSHLLILYLLSRLTSRAVKDRRVLA